MKTKAAVLLIVLTGMTFAGVVGEACPNNLKSMKTSSLNGLTLCQLYDQYQSQKNALSKQGVAFPDYIAEVLVPRFVNTPRWNQIKEQVGYRPEQVYQPAPQTWLGWKQAQDLIQHQLKENKDKGRIQYLTEDFLKSLHKKLVDSLALYAGQYRTSGEYAAYFWKMETLDQQQIQSLTDPQAFGSFDNLARPLLTWIPTLCLENQTPQTVQYMQDRAARKDPYMDLSYWPAVNKDDFFTDGQGQKKQCGYILYTQPEHVEQEMKIWLKKINQEIQLWNKGKSSQDPVQFIAHVQRQFIAIHPFGDGNGRTSRLIMDYLTQSLGLPASLLSDMNHDIDVSESQWGQEIGKGLIRVVQILKVCTQEKNLNQKSCQQIEDYVNAKEGVQP